MGEITSTVFGHLHDVLPGMAKIDVALPGHDAEHVQ